MENNLVLNVPEIFGSMVFNDSVMKEKLPEETYESIKKSVKEGTHLDKDIANTVANAMKNWAVEKGVTHYTHWFQPMTGITAEKHDSFITPTSDGHVIMDFSGKELIKSEPDASSFPSGGLRATFEARGYTAWDPTSYAFIKDETLCIPSVFCSYGGQILDKKTPLLRSIEAIDKHAMRIIKLFGNPTNAKHVLATVGAEQEYFLIDKELFNEREDLIICGRTLFGSKPPKGQEMEDHYFGIIKPRVASFMRDLDIELWKLGVLSKTKHNEVAPSQHELAPIYSPINIATDQNQLTMETMKKVATKHGLACLLHEKPFAGVNGSGKHNNWSISTDTGINLFEPSDSPMENSQFLLFLAAVVKGVDEYQDLLRVAVTGAGNDHRLGANEAPPAIVSMFLGEELDSIIKSIQNDEVYVQKDKQVMKSGVSTTPRFAKDTTDRNRTSPFAFTGNKFEFRMLGSTASIACPNTILNAILADQLSQFADILENSDDFDSELHKLIKTTFIKHSRIIFNGNNYSDEWVVEAERRGLLNLRTTPEALPYYINKKNVELFERHHIYTEEELSSRYEILMDNYCKIIHIEALTMLEMVKKCIFPSICAYMNELGSTAANKKAVVSDLACELEINLIKKMSALSDSLYKKCSTLESNILDVDEDSDIKTKALYYKDVVFVAMQEMRAVADELETITAQAYWPFPSYTQLLYGV
ncbi:MAG: glutamine synthetase type III [Clostridia bacterium]|nr:glutamine synthetase type III [Clostridia bacterium]